MPGVVPFRELAPRVELSPSRSLETFTSMVWVHVAWQDLGALAVRSRRIPSAGTFCRPFVGHGGRAW